MILLFLTFQLQAQNASKCFVFEKDSVTQYKLACPKMWQKDHKYAFYGINPEGKSILLYNYFCNPLRSQMITWSKKSDQNQMIWSLLQGKKPIESDMLALLVWKTYLMDSSFAIALGSYFTLPSEKFTQIHIEHTFKQQKQGKVILVKTPKPNEASPDSKKREINMEISLIQKQHQVEVKWPNVSSLYWAYQIYRKQEDGPWLRLQSEPYVLNSLDGKKDHGVFQDDSLKHDQQYTYQVKAWDVWGHESEIFLPKGICFQDMRKPKAVDRFNDSLKQEAVWLSWQQNKTLPLLGFRVWRSAKIKEAFLPLQNSILPAQTRLFIDKPLKNRVWYYKIETMAWNGQSTMGPVKMVHFEDDCPPLPVQNVLLKGDSGIVKLSWKENMESNLWGYLIYKSIASKPVWIRQMAKPTVHHFWYDTLGIKAQSGVKYLVFAMDSSYRKSFASDTISYFPPDLWPPEPTFFISVKQENDSLGFQWHKSADPKAKGYILSSLQKEAWNIECQVKHPLTHTKFIPKSTGKQAWYLQVVDQAGNISTYSEPFFFHVKSTIKDPQKWEANAKFSLGKKKSMLIWRSFQQEKDVSYVISKREIDQDFLPLSAHLKTTSWILPAKDILDPLQKAQWRISVLSSKGKLIAYDEW